MTKEEAIKHLQNKESKLCSFSTADKTGKPESAIVGYAIRDDGILIISTKKDTRKWKNVLENNKVAVVIGFGFDEPNLQYEGTAQALESGDEFDKCMDFFFSVNPRATKFRTPQSGAIKVTPTWMRFTDMASYPSKADEFSF